MITSTPLALVTTTWKGTSSGPAFAVSARWKMPSWLASLVVVAVRPNGEPAGGSTVEAADAAVVVAGRTRSRTTSLTVSVTGCPPIVTGTPFTRNRQLMLSPGAREASFKLDGCPGPSQVAGCPGPSGVSSSV